MSLRDITEHRRNEARLYRLNRTLTVLSECNQALVRAEDEVKLLDDFCRHLVEIGGFRFAWVGYLEDEARSVRPVAYAGYEAGYLDTVKITWAETERGRGPTGIAIRTGEPVVTQDTFKDPRFAPWRAEAVKRGYRSTIALPLQSAGRMMGSLNIYAQEPDAFDDEEIKRLMELASDLAFGIHSLRTRVARVQAETMLNIHHRALEASRNGVLIVDIQQPDNPIVYVNPAFEKITGYTTQEVLGRNPRFLYGKDPEQPELAGIHAALGQRHEGSVVLRNFRKDGSLFWNDLYIAPVRNEAGQITHYVGIINDITDHRRYEEQLERQANHDELTGLPNRNLMQDRLHQAIVQAERDAGTVAVLFLDLDQFKVINDSLGHRVGDMLLKVMAQRLEGCLREGDTVARYGGDEFIIILPDLTRLQDVTLVAERILAAASQPVEVEEHDLQVTISIGASLYPYDGKDVDTLLKNADAAMYRAKALGRNNFQCYTAELNHRIMERLTLTAQLRHALDRGEFILHYQPQVDLQTGHIIGMEALVRWQHPELGLVSPARFIPLAEETGLIGPLGEWVMRSACAQNKAWQEAGLPPICVTVNLSARQLAQRDLVQTIVKVLEETGLDPKYLELELTESGVMTHPEEMLGRLRQLKEVGLRISLDDFGTGYSSLSYLKRFPFDKLKIDQSFARDITSDPNDAAIALTIIAMAQSLKLRVTAEGVETQGQLDYLTRHGCDEIQGYYFSPPIPGEEAMQLLREGRHLPAGMGPQIPHRALG